MDLYVGSIPFKWKEQDLMELFLPFGHVESAKIIIDKITRQNKGFGFVAMPDAESAGNAINALNGKEFDGRNIVVNMSQPKPEKHDNSRESRPKMVKKEFDKRGVKSKKQLPPWLRKEY